MEPVSIHTLLKRNHIFRLIFSVSKKSWLPKIAQRIVQLVIEWKLVDFVFAVTSVSVQMMMEFVAYKPVTWYAYHRLNAILVTKKSEGKDFFSRLTRSLSLSLSASLDLSKSVFFDRIFSPSLYNFITFPELRVSSKSPIFSFLRLHRECRFFSASEVTLRAI